MNRFADIEALLADVAARGLTHFTLGYFDHNGHLRAKAVHVDALAAGVSEGLALHPGVFTTAPNGELIPESEFSDPAAQFRDALVVLDPSSRRDDPLGTQAHGLLLLGQLEPPYAEVCPRALLAGEVARYEALGLSARAAFEFEFRLLEESRTSLSSRTPDAVAVRPGAEWFYSFADQSAGRELLGAISKTCSTMGLPAEAYHTELADLIEFALHPAPPMRAADDAGLFRAAAKAIAKRHGLMASFMARLNAASQGAGAHINLSVTDAAGEALFALGTDGEVPTRLRHFMGGLQQYAGELFLAFAPNLNSYRRFEPGLFAPTNLAWGIDNKTVAFRVVRLTPRLVRIENRLPGADVHPHLALTAMLAAGRRGLEAAIEPSPPVRGDAWSCDAGLGPPLPGGFDDAVDRFERSEFAREVFGARFVSNYVTERRWQRARLAATITDWELRMFAEGA